MRGLMTDSPLLISSLIRHAARVHGDQAIVSRSVEGPIHRSNYRQIHERAQRLARALEALGVRPSDRVATLAWNNHRHLEVYFAVSGMGAICHTLNPRLFPEQLLYILQHAGDVLLLCDLTFLPLAEKLAPHCPALRGVIALAGREQLPARDAAGGTPPTLHAYEDLIADQPADYTWPVFDEHTASSLCYTSGTTGDPKGVLYSHRSTLLHSFAIALPDLFCLGEHETVLPVVPMFHVNAWGIPYAAAMTGTRLVLPGPRLDGESIHALLESERVTMTAGVPTVWMALLTYMRQHGLRFSTLKRVIIGGSAAPESMVRAFQDEFGVEVRHAWGMTETSPLGTFCSLTPEMRTWPKDQQLAVQLKQGRPAFGVELRIVDDEASRALAQAWLFATVAARPGTGAVFGRVTDAQAQGAPGVRIEAGSSHFAVTDAAGYYALRGLVLGPREISCMDPACGGPIMVDIAAAEVDDVDFSLAP